MILRETGYKMEFPKDSIKLFEERVLASGLCDFIVPMSFRTRGNVKKVTYDCSGYVSVRDLKPETIKEIFEILEKTLLTISKSSEFLILPDKLEISQDTVYYNLKKRNVRLAFVPVCTGTLWDHIYQFVEELLVMADEEAANYLMEIMEEGRLNNYNIKELANLVSEQRKIIFSR